MTKDPMHPEGLSEQSVSNLLKAAPAIGILLPSWWRQRPVVAADSPQAWRHRDLPPSNLAARAPGGVGCLTSALFV
jgi:hypothetical protein